MYLEKLTYIQLKNIYDDIGVTEESLRRDVKYLMDWLEKQPHLPNVKEEDILAGFLIRCKNSLEKTKKKLDLYYSGRAILPEIFTNRDPTHDSFKRTFFSLGMILSPELTPEGDRVVFFRVFDPVQADFITMDDYLKMVYMIFEIQLKMDKSRKIIFVCDMENISLNLFTQIAKGARKVQAAVSKDMNPLRVNKTIILHMKPILAGILNIGKTYVQKKLADSIEIWDNEADLSKIMPIEMIPSNYGGKEKSLEELRDQFYEYILLFREWFQLQDEIKGDISKRTDDLFKEISLHGVDGSFRQLSMD